jgi:hypothetical protein
MKDPSAIQNRNIGLERERKVEKYNIIEGDTIKISKRNLRGRRGGGNV